MSNHEFALGRLEPQDFEHIEKYPAREVGFTTVAHVEDVLPLPYYMRPKYDQGSEGACVGFASSWMKSIKERRFFDAYWLYKEAQKIDGWAGEDYSGTSVRAGMDVLRTRGHRLKHRHSHTHHEDIEYGIAANRWATSVDQLRACIAAGNPIVVGSNWYSAFDAPTPKGREFWVPTQNIGYVRGGHAWCIYGASDRRQAFKMVNSWGKEYPLTWFSYELVGRLLSEYGEATIITDR